jgi:hypothetical protein
MRTVSELTGMDLAGFEIVEMTEVYRVNEDGQKSTSLGFFKNANIAEAFAGTQRDKDYHRTSKALVLTNNVLYFVIHEQVTVNVFNDEEEVLKIKAAVMAKLSPAERKLFGFGD